MSRVGSRLVAALAAAAALPGTAAAATFHVTTTTDQFGTGSACSLREAVTAANTNAAMGGCPRGAGAADVIDLPAGIYALTRPGAVEDENVTGDLDVLTTVTLRGAGRGRTIIDARRLDRVLSVSFTGTLTVDRLTITGGLTHGAFGGPGGPSEPGGGIYSVGAALTVSDSEVVGNRTGDGGAGAAQAGVPGLAGGGAGETKVGDAGWGSGFGGGIYSGGTALSIVRSSITGNATGRGGDGGLGSGGAGGIGNSDGNAGGSGGTGQGGTGGASGEGGGISAGAPVSITESRITDNTTGAGGAGGAGLGGSGGDGGPVGDGAGGPGGNGRGGAGGYAGAGGGVNIVGDAPITLEDSTIAGNRAGRGGLGGLGAGGLGGDAGSGNAPGGAGGDGTAGRGGDGGIGGGLYANGSPTVLRNTFDSGAAGDGGGSAGAVGGDGGAGSGDGTGGSGGDAKAQEGAPGGGGGNVHLLNDDSPGPILRNTTVLDGVGGDGGVPGLLTAGDGGPGHGTGDGGAGGDAVGDSAGGGGAGGGILVEDRGALDHVTVAGNRAGDGAGLGSAQAGMGGAAGGGVGSSPGAGGAADPGTPGSSPTAGGVAADPHSVELMRSVVAENTPEDCTVGGFLDGGGNVSFPTATCPGLVADPQLGPLQDNGGPTETRALGLGSAAIDIVDLVACAAIDQRGVTRPRGPACDAGAYEVAPPTVTVTSAATTRTGAVIAGRVTPNARPTSYRVVYGKTTAYGSQTLDSEAGSGTRPATVLVAVRGLRPSTTYHYRLLATNADGTSVTADRTFRTKPPDTTAPAVSSLDAAPARFAKGGRGTTFSWSLSEPARVAFRFARLLKGRRVAGRCRKQTRANRSRPRCRRVRPLGGFTLSATAGANQRHFPGRLGGRDLPAGRYRVTLVATDASQNASAPKRARFRITRR